MTALTGEFIVDVVDSVEGVVGMVIETYKHPTDSTFVQKGDLCSVLIF
jgi:hypothetical protein